jgi:hypothetical protein
MVRTLLRTCHWQLQNKMVVTLMFAEAMARFGLETDDLVVSGEPDQTGPCNQEL